MSSWKPTQREPAKTKAELREMLAEAVRNTAPPKPDPQPPKAKKDRSSLWRGMSLAMMAFDSGLDFAGGREFCAALERAGDGLKFPIKAHLASARKRA
jgi:hypothetical protein